MRSPVPARLALAGVTFLSSTGGCGRLPGLRRQEAPSVAPLPAPEDRPLAILVRHLGDEGPVPSRGSDPPVTPDLIQNLRRQILRHGDRAVPLLVEPLRFKELPPLGPGASPQRTDGILQQRCVETLVRVGEGAVDPLLALAADSSARLAGRRLAVSALSELAAGPAERPSRPVAPATRDRIARTMIGFLGDRDVEVRSRAASVLGRLRDASARLPLERLLEDEDDFVRKHAASALGEIGDPGSLPALQAREPLERSKREAWSQGRTLPEHPADALDEVVAAIAQIRRRALRGALPDARPPR